MGNLGSAIAGAGWKAYATMQGKAGVTGSTGFLACGLITSARAVQQC